MKFLDNILRRKLAIVPASEPQPEPDALQELYYAQSTLRVTIEGLQAKVRAADEQLAEIARLSDALNIRISEGASDATTAANVLASEELQVRRVRDGLRLRIENLTQELKPLEEKAAEIARVRDLQRQDALVADLRCLVDEKAEELAAQWKAACRTAFDLMEGIYAPIASASPVVLDEEHRIAVMQLKNMLDRRLHLLSLQRVNGNWEVSRPGAFPTLSVIPGRPREVASGPIAEVVGGTAVERKVVGLEWRYPSAHPPALPRSQ
jgi:hypothetical protein